MRYQVLCKSKYATEGELLLTVRANDEQAAIRKVYRYYKGVEHAEVVHDYTIPDLYRSHKAPLSVAHKRGINSRHQAYI